MQKKGRVYMKKKITEILSTMSEKKEIFEEDSLKEDLMLDSFSFVSLLIELERAFDIIFEESDLDYSELKTVGDVFTLVEKYVL